MLLILFVLILNIKICRLNYFIQYPTFIKEILKLASRIKSIRINQKTSPHTLQLLFWKVTFSGTQKSLQPTVFNLQVSDWFLCEEKIGAHYQFYRLTYKLWTLFFKKNLSCLFSQKNTHFSKHSRNCIIHFFFKKL